MTTQNDRFTIEGQEWHAESVAAQDKADFIAKADPDFYISKEPNRLAILGKVHDTAVAHVAAAKAKTDKAAIPPAVKTPTAVATKKPAAQDAHKE